MSLAEAADADKGHCLLFRRSCAQPEQWQAYLVWGPQACDVPTLVRVAGSRWRIESAFEMAKQDPELATAAGGDAGGTQKKGQDAELDLFFLDETGFSTSLPPTDTWAPAGVRPVVPEGRRVNVLAALAAHGTHRHAPLTRRIASHPWKGKHVLAFLRQALPGHPGIPRIVVLDNAGIHRSRTVRQARRELAEQGIWLWYLPAYSPEPNDIERTFRTVKHGAMPQRTFTTTEALTAAVETAFGQVNAQLQPSE